MWQTRLVNPDFAEFARSCGADARTVSQRDELVPALAAALGHEGPSLVHVSSDVALV